VCSGASDTCAYVQSDAGTYFLVVKRGSTFAYGLGRRGEMFYWILRRLFVQKIVYICIMYA
jgi:hypothetical protein